MTRETPKTPKAKTGLTVKVPDAVADGKGGYLPVGAEIEPSDPEAKASLVAKGLAA